MQPIRILLVEDNRLDIYLIRLSLKERGIAHQVQVIEDGEDALRFLDRLDAGNGLNGPQLLILDLNLPRHSGEEILERLRRSPRFSAIPVIILTSLESPRHLMEAAGLNAISYFRKPCELAEFLCLGDVVAEVLQNRLQVLAAS
ncbi:MAG TPA: response regulator [Bryobacteraceae bacterium]|nr:response regulator [Bryobacteraceae bacterium]